MLNTRLHRKACFVVILCAAAAWSWDCSAEQEAPAATSAELTREVQSLRDQLATVKQAITKAREQLEAIQQENVKLRSAIEQRPDAGEPKPANPVSDDTPNIEKDEKSTPNLEVCKALHQFTTAFNDVQQLEMTDLQRRTKYLEYAQEYNRAVTNKRILLSAKIKTVSYYAPKKAAFVYLTDTAVKSGDPDVPDLNGHIFEPSIALPMSEANAAKLKPGDLIEIEGPIRTDLDLTKPGSRQPAFLLASDLTGYVYPRDNSVNAWLSHVPDARVPHIWISKKSTLKVAGVQKKWLVFVDLD